MTALTPQALYPETQILTVAVPVPLDASEDDLADLAANAVRQAIRQRRCDES